MNGTQPLMTGNGTASLHATATVAQIQQDLVDLVLDPSAEPGTAKVQFTIYDQAGVEATHLVGVTVHAA